MVYEMFCFIIFYGVCFLLLVCPRTRTSLIYFCSKSLYLYGSTPFYGGLWLDLIIWLLSVCCFHVSYSYVFALCLLVNVSYLCFFYALC